MFTQEWPIDKINFEPVPFLTTDFMSGAIFGGVLEPFAVSSKGVGIYIYDLVSLHVSLDKKKEKFCIRADKKKYNGKYNTTKMTLSNSYIQSASETISEKYIESCITNLSRNQVGCQINK